MANGLEKFLSNLLGLPGSDTDQANKAWTKQLYDMKRPKEEDVIISDPYTPPMPDPILDMYGEKWPEEMITNKGNGMRYEQSPLDNQGKLTSLNKMLLKNVANTDTIAGADKKPQTVSSPYAYPSVEPESKDSLVKQKPSNENNSEFAATKSTGVGLEEPPKAKGIDILDQLLAAQQAQSSGTLMATLAQAGSDIGAAIAGVKGKENVGAGIKELAGQPVQHLKEQVSYQKAANELNDEAAQNDPNSSISKSTRELINQMGGIAGVKLNIPAGLSYTQMAKLYPHITQTVSTKMAADARREANAQAREQKEESRKVKLTADQHSFIERSSNHLNKDVEQFKKLDQAYNNIMAMNEKSGIEQIGAVYQLIKGWDPASAVREGEINLALTAASVPEKLSIAFQKLTQNPQLLSPRVIKQIKSQMQKIHKDAAMQYRKSADLRLRQAESRGIPSERFDEIDPFYSTGVNIGMPSPNTNNSGLSEKQNMAIEHVMKKNNISREEAYNALKDNDIFKNAGR